MRKSLSILFGLLAPLAYCQETLAPYAEEEIQRIHRELAPLLKLSDGQSGNLARGKSYVLSEAPNMGTCTGESDLTDLTNGKAESSASGVWFCADCVGWSSKRLVCVTLDLGESQSFDRVKLFCGAGRAGVSLPSALFVEVSENGKDFFFAGDLVSLTKVGLPRQGIGHQEFVFEGQLAPVQARYVRLRMRPTGQYLTITEIEVLKAAETGTACTALPPAPADSAVIEQGEKAAVAIQIRESMLRLLDSVEENEGLKQDILHWNFEGGLEDYKAIYPLSALQEKIFARHAAKLRAAGQPGLVIQPVDFYAALSPASLPTDGTVPVMSQVMMNNEVRGTAVAFCNTTEQEMTVTASLEGLEGDLYELCYIDSEFFFTTSTALRPLTTLRAVPGMVNEIAVILRPENLAPGMHRGSLKLTAGDDVRNLPIELEILPGTFPSRPKLAVYGWEYLDQPTPTATTAWLGLPVSRFDEFRKMRIQDLCFGTAGVGAQELAACTHAIEVSQDGDILSKLDFAIFDRWLNQNPDAALYMVVGIGQSLKDGTFGDKKLEPGTPAFEKALESYARLWNEHIVAKGLQGKFLFALFDEPGLASDADHEAEYTLIQQWHRPFHKGAPDIQLFIDPCGQYDPAMNKYLDSGEVVCPEVELFHGEHADEVLAAFRQLAADGHVFHTYSCSHGPYLSEPGAFRNQAWMTYLIGGTATGFWGATELRENTSFNRYIAQGHHFSPYLLDKQGLSRTKHAFALRDAVQDFEYLKLCEKALENAALNGVDTTACQALLEAEVQEISAARDTFSKAGTNRAVRAEEGRRKVIQILKELQAL